MKKHIKLYEEFHQDSETPIDAVDDMLTEEDFKALVTKLIDHELTEEESEEKEAEEVAEAGLTKEELTKVKSFIEANWAPKEEETPAEETSTDVTPE